MVSFVDPVVKKPEQRQRRDAEENAGDAADFPTCENTENHRQRMEFHASVH